jgi:hypothetical protein
VRYKKEKKVFIPLCPLSRQRSINRISLPSNWFEWQGSKAATTKLCGYNILLLRDSYLFAFFLCAHMEQLRESYAWITTKTTTTRKNLLRDERMNWKKKKSRRIKI